MSIFTEQADLEAVMHMMQELPYVDSGNLFLMGSSQGGAVSAITAAAHKEEIKGAILLYPAFCLVDMTKERFESVEDIPDTYFALWMTVGRTYAEKLLDYDIYEVIPGADHGFYGEEAELAIGYMLDYLNEHIDDNSEMKEAETSVQISIITGETTSYAELDNSETAQEFAAMLPQTISMQRVGDGREFYGGIDQKLHYDEADVQTSFENGDLAYWFSGNGFCIPYNNQVDDPEVESGIVVFGRITSDLSVFYDMEDRVEVTVELLE